MSFQHHSDSSIIIIYGMLKIPSQVKNNLIFYSACINFETCFWSFWFSLILNKFQEFVYQITDRYFLYLTLPFLDLNISASIQNIKKLICNFGAIHARIMHASFQASSFTCVGGE